MGRCPLHPPAGGGAPYNPPSGCAGDPGRGPLTRPPTVLDHADAKQSHLDGLCLSRAWCFTHLGKPDEAKRHLEAGMPHVVGGDYAGEHWLASFALLALSAATLKTP